MQQAPLKEVVPYLERLRNFHLRLRTEEVTIPLAVDRATVLERECALDVEVEKFLGSSKSIMTPII